jgi:sortase (surface protein transpeptidase)
MSKDLYNEYIKETQKPIIPGFSKRVSRVTLFMAKACLVIGIVLLIIAYAPSIWYSTSPEKIANITNLLAQTATKTPQEVIEESKTVPEIKEPYQPKENRNLPLEHTIVIPSVGIETVINEAPQEQYEEALKLGVWRVTNFGTPHERELPTILAAHRYGYLKWSIPYRLKNSFYNLPKVKVGDTVEMNWRQRKYVYEIYAEDKGEEITDYDADLILYTCESLNSSVRVIKYARLLEI